MKAALGWVQLMRLTSAACTEDTCKNLLRRSLSVRRRNCRTLLCCSMNPSFSNAATLSKASLFPWHGSNMHESDLIQSGPENISSRY